MTNNIFTQQKIILWLIGFCFALANVSAVVVQVRYPEEIKSLTREDLNCLRMATLPSDDQTVLAQRETLVQKARELFSIERVIAQIRTQPPENVIIWLTNYYGDISKKTLQWYSKNVFEAIAELQDTRLWGVNLDKWLLFANTRKNILEFYTETNPMMAQKIANLADSRNNPFSASNCPLTRYSETEWGTIRLVSEIIEDGRNICSRFCTLQSSKFFSWLYTLPTEIMELINARCKTLYRPRPETVTDRFSCSLQQLGYMPLCLSNVWNCDIYTLLPLLQYLEAIYYVGQIVHDTGSKSICFLFNLREIVFYSVLEDTRLFETFERDMQAILSATLPELRGLEITVDMGPFLYKDLVKAPYKDGCDEISRECFVDCMKHFFGKKIPRNTPGLQDILKAKKKLLTVEALSRNDVEANYTAKLRSLMRTQAQAQAQVKQLTNAARLAREVKKTLQKDPIQ